MRKLKIAALWLIGLLLCVAIPQLLLLVIAIAVIAVVFWLIYEVLGGVDSRANTTIYNVESPRILVIQTQAQREAAEEILRQERLSHGLL